MKTLLLLLVLMGFAAAAPAQHSPDLNSLRVSRVTSGERLISINFSWSYPSYPTCPKTAPASCVSGFKLTDLTSGQVLATSKQLGPAARKYSWLPRGRLFTGTHTFSLIAVGYNASGTATTSAATTEEFTNE